MTNRIALISALMLSAALAHAQPALSVSPVQPQISITPNASGQAAPDVTVTGAPGLVVTPGPVTTVPSSAALPAPRKVIPREELRPDLQNYATAMDWASALVSALAVALVAGFLVVRRAKVAATPVDLRRPSPLKQARDEKHTHKAARKAAAQDVAQK